MLDFLDLELESYGYSTNVNDSSPIRPETLGTILACIWKLNRDEQGFNGFSKEISEHLMNNLDTMPQEVEETLNLEKRSDGSHQFSELTQIIVGAQGAGLLGRLNPSNTHTLIKVDNVDAISLLSYYEAQHPETVSWLQNTLQKGV